jgi:predicted nucleotidyltransferase
MSIEHRKTFGEIVIRDEIIGQAESKKRVTWLRSQQSTIISLFASRGYVINEIDIYGSSAIDAADVDSDLDILISIQSQTHFTDEEIELLRSAGRDILMSLKSNVRFPYDIDVFFLVPWSNDIWPNAELKLYGFTEAKT